MNLPPAVAPTARAATTPLSTAGADSLALRLLMSVAALSAIAGVILAVSQAGMAHDLAFGLWSVALFGVYVGATAVALVTGGGVHTIALGLYGVIVVVAGTTVGLRALAGFALLCTATLLAMYVAELQGRLAGVAGLARLPLEARFGTQLLLVAAGTAFGGALSQLLLKSLRRAREQERRFAGLLDIAADYYWELDAELRFTHISEGVNKLFGDPKSVLGKPPWELPGASQRGVDWDSMRTDMLARRPFRSLLLRRRTVAGAEVFISVSGEPMFDGRGRFRGYWGVSRNVTADIEAQRARAASEQRFLDLFEMSPTAIVLHRRKEIVRVNAAAADLFGFPDTAGMVGQTMTAHRTGRRPGQHDAVLRRHRAAPRRRAAALLGGDAVAAVRGEPRLHDHQRPGEQPAGDGQRRLHPPGGMGARRGGRTRSNWASGTTRSTAAAWSTRCASAARRSTSRSRCAAATARCGSA
ncbi:MAG: PAS domain S-box protein [Burkholderiaceae bacterium]|nr:PAS domain S-box protein [Burkholderiaceae bacterium]